jgi:putative ABC exporter
MDRALTKLFRLRMYGGLRRRLQTLKTPRGMVFFMVGVAVLAFCVNAGNLTSASGEVSRVFSTEDTFQSPAREVMPFLLLAACLVTIATTSGPAIYFSPAEVNFLFAGPFSRRSLLLYKFFSFAIGAAISGLIVAALLPHYAGGRVAAFTGAFLSLIFIQLFSASIGLVGQIVAERAYTRLRRYVLLLVVAAVALGCWPVVASGMDQGFVAILGGFRHTLIGTVLLAPFEVFVMTFSAERIYPDLLLWGSAAVAIDVAMLGAMIWADANYFEATAATSQRMYRRWQRARRGGMIWSFQRAAEWHLPVPPSLGGAGPIAWRQLTTAVRTSGKVLVVLLIVATAGGPLLILSGGRGTSPWTTVGILGWATLFLLPRIFNFDFRNDVEHLAELKALPLAPMVAAAGQLVVPVLLLTSLQLVALCGAAVCATGVPRALLLGTIPFILPLNVLLFGLENLIFLLFPTRLVPLGRVDFEFFGRMLVELTVKCLLISAACCLAAVLGAVAYRAAGQSWVLFGLVAWLVLSSIAIATLPCVGWAYRRFDVSLHLPY